MAMPAIWLLTAAERAGSEAEADAGVTVEVIKTAGVDMKNY